MASANRGRGLPEFVDHIVSQLGTERPARARAMFGGYSVYRCLPDGDRMVGLVADDVLYLKADSENAKAFDAEGLEHFVYDSGKPGRKPMAMSYRRAPDAALEDRDLLGHWFDIGLAAALRAPAPKKRRKARPQS